MTAITQGVSNLDLANINQNIPQNFELRWYQLRVIDELRMLYARGYRRPFVYAPTAAGKTCIAAYLMSHAVSKGGKCLFLVHRDILVEQTLEALQEYGLTAGVIKQGYAPDESQPIQIAGMQSLARRSLPDINFTIIVGDECHTTYWQKPYEEIKQKYQGAFFIGLTATPWRTKSSKEYMGQHCDSIVKCPGIDELISLGYLAPPRYFGFGGLLDLSELDDGNDEYNQFETQMACARKAYNDEILEKYIQFGENRKTVIFCAGVEQSKLIAMLFNAAGIPTEHVDAGTPNDYRKEIYRRIEEGVTQCISSVGVITEGFNLPAISCVILARPTKSRALLFQAAGRGLRLAPGKIDCLMLDFGENFKRIGYLTDLHPIQLEPLEKKGQNPPLKECPSCKKLVFPAVRICPYCGHIFDILEKEEKNYDDWFDNKFGELFPDGVQRDKVKWLRSRIRWQYKNNKPIDEIWTKFKIKFGHYQPNDWHLGAVFGGDTCDAVRQQFLSYLHRVNSSPTQDWVNFHMRMEFGFDTQRQNTNQSQGRKFYEKSKPAEKPKTWYEILELSPDATYDQVKEHYREIAKHIHPDVQKGLHARAEFALTEDEANARMKLINHALDMAKKHFGIK